MFGRHRCALGFAALFLAGCDLPKDPDETLERVRQGTLRAGLVAGERHRDSDRERLARLTARLNAKLDLVEGDAHALVDGLEKGDLDLVVSLPKNTPFRKPGYTHPVAPPMDGEKPPVWAVPAGENAWLLELNRFIEADRP